MFKSSSKYTSKVTLLVKKDGNMKFYGNYRPLNAQTQQYSFPMPLIDDVGLVGKIGMVYCFEYLIWVLANFNVT